MSRKRTGLPTPKLIRYLIAKPRAGGFAYYWQPPTKLRAMPNRPDWLKATALKDDRGRFMSLEAAMKAAEILNARLDAWRAGRSGNKGGLAALIGLYLKSEAFRKRAPRTQADYEKYLSAISEDMGDAEPAHVTAPVIARYREHLVANKGVGERSADYRVQMLRLLFTWAKRFGHHVGENPASKPGLKGRKARDTRWPLAALRQVATASYPVGLAAKLALYTVQRQGDILAMRWSDIEDGTMTIRQRKTGALVRLPLHPALLSALDAAPRRGDTVLAASAGMPYSESGFRAMFRRAAGQGAPTFHDIRRTAATELAAGGVPDARIKLWTGHKRRGDDAILDVYIVAQDALRSEVFPIMDQWGV